MRWPKIKNPFKKKNPREKLEELERKNLKLLRRVQKLIEYNRQTRMLCVRNLEETDERAVRIMKLRYQIETKLKEIATQLKSN